MKSRQNYQPVASMIAAVAQAMMPPWLLTHGYRAPAPGRRTRKQRAYREKRKNAREKIRLNQGYGARKYMQWRDPQASRRGMDGTMR